MISGNEMMQGMQKLVKAIEAKYDYFLEVCIVCQHEGICSVHGKNSWDGDEHILYPFITLQELFDVYGIE